MHSMKSYVCICHKQILLHIYEIDENNVVYVLKWWKPLLICIKQSEI